MESQEQLAAVARMQKLIAENLSQPISLSMLAATANYSPWHSSRLFTEITGKTPFEYIRTLRLSQAAQRLWDNETKVIWADEGLEAGPRDASRLVNSFLLILAEQTVRGQPLRRG